MQARSTVRAAPEARALANEMLAMEGVMEEILDETIPDGEGETVTESGRTLCGPSGEVHGPLARFAESVELASCPTGNGGTWHTHVTKSQLRNPSNSLPDMANVFFGEIDTSIVVGTQSADAVIAAEDPHQAGQEFQDALGVEVGSPEDVVDAIIGGEVRSPSDARERVRSRLSGMFETRSVHFPDLDRRLEMSGIPAHTSVSFEMLDAQHHAMVARQIQARDHIKNPVRDPKAMKRHIRSTNHDAKEAAKEMRLHEYAARSAIGEVVGRVVRSVL